MKKLHQVLKISRQKNQVLYSINEGDLESVIDLIKEDLPPNSTIKGFSLLTLAIWYGRFEIFNFLIEIGASITKPGNDHFVCAAVKWGRTDLVEMALNAGHNIHLKHKDTPTALQQAAYNNNFSMMKYLIERGANKDDIDLRQFSWVRIHPDTKLILRNIGVEVPD